MQHGNGKRRPGWDCERGAAAKGMSSETHFSRHVNPLMENVALLMLLDCEATQRDLAAAYDRLNWDTVAEARLRLMKFDRRKNEGSALPESSAAQTPLPQPSRLRRPSSVSS